MSSLETVVLPNTMRELPESFVAYSYSLKNIRLPDSLVIIRHAAFYTSAIDSIVIPDNVRNIEGYTFSYAFNLRKVDIGRGIRSIMSYAFNKNKLLESVTIRSENPPELALNAFNEIPENTVLYVPASAVEKYRNHPDWQVFRKIEAIRE